MDEIRKFYTVNGKEREYIYFKVKFNRFRDVSGAIAHAVADKEEWAETEAVLCLPESYTADGEETQLVLCFHGAGGRKYLRQNRNAVLKRKVYFYQQVHCSGLL